MTQAGHLFWRAFVILAGLVLGLAMAGLVTLLIMIPSTDDMRHMANPGMLVERFMLVGFAGFYVVNALSGPAVAIAVAFGEIRRVRSWLYYVAAGGVCGAAGVALWEPGRFGQQEIAIVMAAGFAAGFVYWLIAGRSAGLTRDPVPPPAVSAKSKPADAPPAA
ncbi:MAG: hypothetical protein AB7O39_07245 [Flavobacteriaceae bacterium]